NGTARVSLRISPDNNSSSAGDSSAKSVLASRSVALASTSRAACGSSPGQGRPPPVPRPGWAPGGPVGGGWGGRGAPRGGGAAGGKDGAAPPGGRPGGGARKNPPGSPAVVPRCDPCWRPG